MDSNHVSDFIDDTPPLEPQTSANLIDIEEHQPASADYKTSGTDLLISTQSDDPFDLLNSDGGMAENRDITTNYDDQFADLLGDLDSSVPTDDVLTMNANNVNNAEPITTTSSDSDAVHSEDGTELRIEDRLADYQPPKRYAKKEKDYSCGPSVYITGGAGCDNMCKRCNKIVYEMEKMIADKDIYHKPCFRCLHCNRILSLSNFAAIDGQPYCKPHFIELFKKKGNYDTITTAPRNDGAERYDDDDEPILKQSASDEEYSEEMNKEEPIHFEQMSSVRNMFESACRSSTNVIPTPSHTSKWEKPKKVENVTVPENEVPKAEPVVDTPPSEENELPPPAITRNLVARFQGIQQSDASVYNPDRKPVHKITPPRDDLLHGIEEAQRIQQQQQQQQQQGRESFTDEGSIPEIIRAGTEPYPASELPPPKVTQSMLAKFKSLEDLTPPTPSSPDKTTVRHGTQRASKTYNDNKVEVNGSVHVKHSTSLPSTTDRYVEDEHDQCDGREEEKEFPDEGFTKNLLAKWRSMEENTVSHRRADGVGQQRQGKRTTPARAQSLPSYTRAPNRPVVTRQPERDTKHDEDDQLNGEGNKREIIRESDSNEEAYLPPPSFTKNMLAKFETLEAEAEREARERSLPIKKNFRWCVKEAPLISPSGVVWQEKRRRSSVGSDFQPASQSPSQDDAQHYYTDSDNYELRDDDDDVYDHPANQEQELPPASLTKNLVAKFRSLEIVDSSSP